MKDRAKGQITKEEKNTINLSIGKKRAKTSQDHTQVKEIEEIKQRGGTVYIPHD